MKFTGNLDFKFGLEGYVSGYPITTMGGSAWISMVTSNLKANNRTIDIKLGFCLQRRVGSHGKILG